jgi:hypothetical protein
LFRLLLGLRSTNRLLAGLEVGVTKHRASGTLAMSAARRASGMTF